MKTASARPRIVEAAGAGKVTQAFSLCASTENRLKACVTLPPRAGRGRELLFVMLAIAFLTLLASAGAQTPGTLDTGFNPIITNVVIATAVQPDGRIIIAGQFFTVNGTARNCGKYPDINPVWAKNPTLPGARLNLGLILGKGLSLC